SQRPQTPDPFLRARHHRQGHHQVHPDPGAMPGPARTAARRAEGAGRADHPRSRAAEGQRGAVADGETGGAGVQEQDPAQVYRRAREIAMAWKVRHEGSPQSIDVEMPQILEGIEDGRWEPTDEVQGPGETKWVAIENHPQFASA